MPCRMNACESGRKPCPFPVTCGLVTPPDLGEDESGPMERLERSDWGEVASGLIRALATILVLLLALFAGGELRDWYREHQAAGVKR